MAGCLLFTSFAVEPVRAEMQPIVPFAATGEAAPPAAFARPGITAFKPTGPLGPVFAWVLETQQALQQRLAGSVRALKTDNPLAGALSLALLSFLYGVVHAVGPGHGKTIISSYVVANEKTARRGIIVSFIAAALQAVTAVALVSIFAVLLNAPGIEITAWSNQLETVSYAMIAAVGLWLLLSQCVAILRRWRGAPSAVHHHHGHDHDHHEHAHEHYHDHAHHHGHAHAEGEACDHMVDPSTLAGPFSWRKMMAVVFSVGIRPCTGAILVLVFALTQGVFWAGVAATFAMALGTAITVAVLATLALGSRELALKLGGESSKFGTAVWAICRLGGAALIFLFGATLFVASLGPARPF
jgi:ABC-type nickel/cobalt efflux system permease component RcnA